MAWGGASAVSFQLLTQILFRPRASPKFGLPDVASRSFRRRGEVWRSRSLTPRQPFLQWFTNYERAITNRFRSGLSLGSIDRSLSNRRRSQRRWSWAQYLGHVLPTAGQD